MYLVNMASDCTHNEGSFVSLDDLDNISILLDEDNELEEEIAHLFNPFLTNVSLGDKPGSWISQAKCLKSTSGGIRF